MDNDSKESSGMSGKIEDLIVDLGNERFMTRNEALNGLKDMLPAHERAISTELVRWIQLYGKSDVGSSASFVNKAAMDLFQNMTEMGLEPLINDGLKDGDFFARRTAMDAIGRTGRMSILPYLVQGMEDDDKYTRWQAAKGLARFAGSNEAREALVKGLADSNPHVRRRAGRSLEKFGGVGPAEDKVEGPMEEDGKGDIDGDGIPDSEDKEPRKANNNENDYESMTVVQLKEELKGKGLSVSGKKSVLIQRLKK
jgi:HEAT repeat protein|tara:strand:+ start:1731 stop:2492 length:762 start_codon:yes stop_codon:yes gene_type:complete